MAQIEHNLQLIKTGDFNADFNSIQIPNDKVWEILGFRFEMFPELVGTRSVRFEVEVEGNIIFESIAPPLEIIEQHVTSGAASVITGLQGIPERILPAGFFAGAHAVFQLPNRVVLPRNSRINIGINSDPHSSNELKRVYVLVDESMDIAAI